MVRHRIVNDQECWPIDNEGEGQRVVVYDDGAVYLSYLYKVGDNEKLFESTPYFATPGKPFYSYHDCPLPDGYEWPAPDRYM